MSSRERVLRTLEHKQTDRVAADFAAAKGVAESYMKRLGISDYEDLLRMLNIDMRRVGGYSQHILPESQPDEQGYVTTMWGVRRKDSRPGENNQRIIGPFGEDTTLDDVNSYPWPDPNLLDFSTIRTQCEKYHDEYAVYGSPWCHFFHEAGDMFGQEDFLIFMYTKPDIVGAVIDKIVDFEVEATRRFLDAASGLIDITYFGNDFGTQRGLFISPEMWHKFILKPYKRLFDLSHDYGCKVMCHSCGAVRDIIPAMIEAGVNILDPVQSRAEGMSVPGLLKDFAGRIVLHGGVDTQQTLPYGKPDDVRAAVGEYVKASKVHHGYILASSQELTEDIPLENMLAMYDIKLRT